MPSVPYTTSSTETRQRAIVGAGTVADPDVFTFTDVGLGLPTAVSAASPGDTATISSLLRGIWNKLIAFIPTTKYVLYGTTALAVNNVLGAGNTIDVSKFQVFSVDITNTGSVALTALEIATRISPASNMRLRLNAASHFSSPIPSGSIVRSCSDLGGNVLDPTTLAAGATFCIDFDCRDFSIDAFRIRATCGSSTNLSIQWSGS